jgi:uroporphyrin-III C-methyltransferase
VPEPPAPGGSALDRAWTAIKEALSSVFALRRSEGPKPRLLAPDEEALVVQILQLKLEGARLALLANDTRTFHELAVEADAWLIEYYDETNGDVKYAHAELQRLGALQLATSLPDISRSLALLRAQLNSATR